MIVAVFFRVGILTKHLYASSFSFMSSPENCPYKYMLDPSFHVAKHFKSRSAKDKSNTVHEGSLCTALLGFYCKIITFLKRGSISNTT